MNPLVALKGRNVYGAGSHAPTKGRVSAAGAQGYLQRSIRQGTGTTPLGGVRAVGSDGQSDTRSGVAQNANQRRTAQQNNTGPARQPYQNEGRQAANTGRKGSGGARGGHQQAALAAQQQAQQNAIPSVTVNANGQLELPYSQEWSADLISQMAQYNVDLGDLQAEQQQEGLDYQRNTRETEIGYKGQKRNSLNTASGSGTAFSSAYGVQASNDATSYQNQLNDLLTQHNASQTAFDTERTALINAFKQQLQASALGNADNLAENAGQLGYGQDKPKKKPGRNTSAHQGQNKPGKNKHQKAAQNAVKKGRNK